MHQRLQLVVEDIGVFTITNLVHFVLVEMDEDLEAVLAEYFVSHSVVCRDGS